MIEASRLLVVGLLTALATGAVAVVLVRPLPRLAVRVRPYAPAARASLGLPSAPAESGLGVWTTVLSGIGRKLFGSLDPSTERELEVRLRDAGWEGGVTGFRQRQLRALVVGLALGAGVGFAVDLAPVAMAALGVLGAVIGVARIRGRVDKAIEQRRARMQLEVYSVNQLLALRIRAGSGVLQSIADLAGRATGVVIDEMGVAVASIRAGTRPAAAFARLAEETVEPHCARTYAALGSAEQRGADLSGVLFALADDVRRERRELLRRRAVRRRAAMLIPIIALLAPVMLLFITAPLPRIVLGGL